MDFGLALYAISYDLVQTNNIARSVRTQHENWVEKSPTFGLRYHSRDIEVSYAFRMNCNTDCNFLPNETTAFNSPESASRAGGIIAAPSSPLFFQGGSETSHHFMISVPIM
jgi:hypothetical protein